jgi:hypothetical protein
MILKLLLVAAVGLASFKLLEGEMPVRQLAVLLTVPLLLWALSLLQGRAASLGEQGWRRLRPSPMHWIGLVLCLGLTAVMLYVYLFVGSSRADAAKQTNILLGLLLAFGAASIAMIVTCFHAVVRWNEERIESWLGPWQRGAIAWGELAQAEHDGPGTPLVLESMSGIRLKVDATLNGAEELLQRVAPRMPKATYP